MIDSDECEGKQAFWCLHCERGWAVALARFDELGVCDTCPDPECDGGALDMMWLFVTDFVSGNEYPMYGETAKIELTLQGATEIKRGEKRSLKK